MMKVDFRQIPVKDIEGNVQQVDMSKALGNQLYMQGKDIVECELGRKIYYADGGVELTDKQVEVVKRFAAHYSYVLREAVEKALTPEP